MGDPYYGFPLFHPTIGAPCSKGQKKAGDISPASSIQYQIDYRLILRRKIPARPMIPEPNSISELGSGTGESHVAPNVESPILVMIRSPPVVPKVNSILDWLGPETQNGLFKS